MAIEQEPTTDVEKIPLPQDDPISVNAPESGTYGAKAKLERFSQATQPPSDLAPQQSDRVSPANPDPSLVPISDDKPSTLPSQIGAATQMPDQPITALPPQLQQGQALDIDTTSLSSLQGLTQMLTQLATSPGTSPTTKQWASQILDRLNDAP